MPISMECPSCMSAISFADELAGRKTKCPDCQFILFVPRGETAPHEQSPSSPNSAPILDIPEVVSAAVDVVTPVPSKKVRTMPKKSSATTPARASDNPFDFQEKPTTSAAHAKRSGMGGLIAVVVIVLLAFFGLLLVGGGVAAAYIFWPRTKTPEVAVVEKEIKKEAAKEEPQTPEPKKSEETAPPKKEPPKNPGGKPIHEVIDAPADPVVKKPDPIDKKPDPVRPPAKQPRLTLSPILSQTVKAGDKVTMNFSVVREDCKGSVLIKAVSPNARITIAPALSLPQDFDSASLQMNVDVNLPPGMYRIPVSATLDALTDNKIFELTVEKPAAPVVVIPPAADQDKQPLQIANTTIKVGIRVSNAHTGSVECVAMSPDKKWAVSGGADATVRLWELDQEKVATLYTGPLGTSISAVAIAPDGKWVASGDVKGAIRLYNASTKEMRVLQEANKLPPAKTPNGTRVTALEFSPKGDILIYSDALAFGAWDMTTGKKLFASPAGRDTACLHFAPDGQHVYAVFANTIAVLDPRPNGLNAFLGAKDMKPIEFRAAWFDCYGTKQELIAIVPKDKQGELQRINEMTGETQKLVTFETANEVPLRVAVAAKSGYAITGDKDGLIRAWELETGKELIKIPGHKGEIRALAISADGRRFISASADGTFRIHDLTNDKGDAPKPALKP